MRGALEKISARMPEFLETEAMEGAVTGAFIGALARDKKPRTRKDGSPWALMTRASGSAIRWGKSNIER